MDSHHPKHSCLALVSSAGEQGDCTRASLDFALSKLNSSPDYGPFKNFRLRDARLIFLIISDYSIGFRVLDVFLKPGKKAFQKVFLIAVFSDAMVRVRINYELGFAA